MKRIKELLWLMLLSICLMVFFIGCTGGSNGEDAGDGSSQNKQEGETEVYPNEPIVFSDPVFERLLKESLEKDEILPSDLEEYTGVSILADEMILLASPDISEQYYGLITKEGEHGFEFEGNQYLGYGTIQTFQDLKYFVNLDNLKINLHPQANFETIPANDKMRMLTTSQSKLADISFVQNFPNLQYLMIHHNEIESIEPMRRLNRLIFFLGRTNNIKSVDALADLTELVTVDLNENKISDISALGNLTNIEILRIFNNDVEDISALEGLHETLRELELSYNNIKDVSPLKEYKEMNLLNLKGNPVENLEEIDHIENVQFD